MIVFPVAFINTAAAPSPPGGDSLRAALSTSVSNYDSATVGNWVAITAAEYANIKATVTGATTTGMTEAQMGEAGSAWTGTCAYTLPSASASISSGSYIICFSLVGFNAVSATASCLTSTTFIGTYSNVGNSPSISTGSTTRLYWVRKAPTDSVASTSYMASVISAGTRRMSTTIFSGGYYDCSSPYSTWTVWNSGGPQQQFVTTTTKSW